MSDELKGAVVRWRSIDSAPRDGTRILVWPFWSDGLPAEVHWRNGLTDRTRRWEQVGGLHPTGVEPTHWMPLPPPPTESARK